jgi:hypothetical protein
MDEDGNARMEIYLSVGVSALVALMTAHRADDCVDRTMSDVFDRRDRGHVRPELDADNPQAVDCDLYWW